VPSTKVREIAAMLKAIHASEDLVAAREKAIRVIEKLRALRLIRAAELVEAAVEETLTYYAFPEEHWRRIRTTDVFDKPSLTHAALLPFRSAAFPQPRLEGGFSFHPKTKCRYSTQRGRAISAPYLAPS
jgi:hypothetical protein